MRRNSIENCGRAWYAVIAAAVLLGAPSMAEARTEVLHWKHADPGSIAGFKVHWGDVSFVYHTTIDVGKPAPDADGIFQYDLTVPDAATVFVALTAYDDTGLDSAYSNEGKRVPDTGTGDTGTGGTGTGDTGTGGTGTGAAEPPFADNFANGLSQWQQAVGSWSLLSGGELQTISGAAQVNLLSFTAGELATADQCQTMKLVNAVDGGYPGFVFRSSSANLANADRYDVAVNPLGGWAWVPYSGGVWVGGYEDSLAFNSTGSCNTLPCYVSACISGAGAEKKVLVYEHGGSQPPEDPNQWVGDLAGTMVDDPDVTDISDTGTIIGLRLYSGASSQIQRIDDWWADDFTPSGTGDTGTGGTGDTGTSGALGTPGQPILIQ